MIKVIATDIDGTLLNDYGEITDKNKIALKKANELGVKILLCTGRGSSAALVMKKLEIECGGILSNGVYVFDNLNHPPLISNYLSNYIFKDIINYLDNYYKLNYYIVLGYHHDMHMIYKLNFIDNYFINFVNYRKIHKPTYAFNSYIDINDKTVSHIGIIDNFNFLKEVKLNLESIYNKNEINIVLYTAADIKTYGFLEIMHPDASKEKALKKYLESVNLSTENVISIGDNYNDIGLISMAKIGVAVFNSSDDVKRYAKYITKCDNNNSAVAEVINTFLFKEF